MALKRTVPQPALKLPAEREWALRIGGALLLFWLLRSWLVPLQQLSDVTEVYRIAPFLGAFAFFLAVGAFNLPGAAARPLRVAAILSVTAVLHSGQWVPDAGWWSSWLQELSGDALHALSGQFGLISPATRTMLFLTGWCIFIWVLQSFVADCQQLLWFVAMTLLYLVILQLAFDTDMSATLLGAAAAGLLLQSWLQAERWFLWKQANEGWEHASASELAGGKPAVPPQSSTGRERTGPWSRIAASCAMTGLMLLGAWVGAMQHPAKGKSFVGPDILQWQGRLFAGAPTRGGDGAKPASAAAGKTGYSSDDSLLGAPLTTDDAVAFEAWTTRLTYWRGESKSIYTGRGWEQPVSEPVQAMKEVESRTVSEKSEGGETPASVEPARQSNEAVIVQQVLLKQRFRQLFVGGNVLDIGSLAAESGKPVPPDWVWKDTSSGRYFLPALADPLSSYTVRVSANDSERALSSAADQAPGDEYRQLPEQLPVRVGEMARTVTKDAASDYEKARAVENYLRANYTYGLDKTKPPAAGQDFVDQFLFEHRVGYCDHFSSAMVVMLRSAGVPARWVKGFAPGQIVSAESAEADGAAVYHVKVRNKDAHSWVEAYIPPTGWVPFDPTPGYSGGGEAQAASAATADESALSDDGRDIASVLNGLKASASQLIHSGLSRIGSLFAKAGEWLDLVRAGVVRITPLLPLFLWIVAACLLVFAAWQWIRLLRKAAADPALDPRPVRTAAWGRLIGVERVRAFAVHRLAEQLWRKLQRRLGRSGPAQTMREYLLTRPGMTEPQRNSLLQFVKLQEALRYHRGTATVTSRQLRAAWEDVRKSL